MNCTLVKGFKKEIYLNSINIKFQKEGYVLHEFIGINR